MNPSTSLPKLSMSWFELWNKHELKGPGTIEATEHLEGLGIQIEGYENVRDLCTRGGYGVCQLRSQGLGSISLRRKVRMRMLFTEY